MEYPAETKTAIRKSRSFLSEFYRAQFGIKIDNVNIPNKKPEQREFDRLLIVMNGLNYDAVSKACANNFPCSFPVENLGKIILHDERSLSNGSYAIWVPDTLKLDKPKLAKSAQMIEKEHINTETLLERMLHELVYFKETKKHLDTEIMMKTLCSGSRFNDYGVPDVVWNNNMLTVYKQDCSTRFDILKFREVIV